MPSVAALAIAPVKALALEQPQELELEAGGVRGNRRFYLVDENGRLFGGTRHGPLVRVRSEVDGDTLTLHFPDGRSVAGEVALGGPTTTDFYGRPVAGRLVDGPWSDALSGYVGRQFAFVAIENGHPVNYWAAHEAEDRVARALLAELAAG